MKMNSVLYIMLSMCLIAGALSREKAVLSASTSDYKALRGAALSSLTSSSSPSLEASEESSEGFTATACPRVHFGVIRFACPRTATPGCVGYSNGTYEDREDGNSCLFCANANVTSFNADQSCPKKVFQYRGPYGGQHGPVVIPISTLDDDEHSESNSTSNSSSFVQMSSSGNFTATPCPHYIGKALFACSRIATPGCVGYSNGTYQNREDGNSCLFCAKANVTSFNAGETCPQ